MVKSPKVRAMSKSPKLGAKRKMSKSPVLTGKRKSVTPSPKLTSKANPAQDDSDDSDDSDDLMIPGLSSNKKSPKMSSSRKPTGKIMNSKKRK
eukprot:GFYU01035812.1.p1 GENE.GFYU01035812.1~~GFYU01035812.1.p1  ORF type:complete len:107 (-),score=23.57 GFYU01035812.1:80-358(-)